MLKIFENLSDAVKGVFFIFAGVILLFHTLGVLQKGLNYILIIISIYLIALGFVKIGGVEKFKQITQKNSKGG